MDIDDLITIKTGQSKSNSRPKINRNKGKSLNEFPSEYCLIDLETTGLDSYFDDIIEVAMLKVKDNKIIDQYQSLIKPHVTFSDANGNDAYVDNYIEELTGITSSMLEDAPHIEDKLDEILNFISSQIIVGYNVNFDINFLYDRIKTYKNMDLTNDYFDLLKISRRALKDIDKHRLIDIANYFDYNYNAHRALDDCKATFDLLNKLKKHVEENNIDIKPKTSKKVKLDISKIISTTTEIDKENYFYNKNICFTGKLENFVRKDAAQICANLGAKCQNGVTKKTDVLVLGNFDYNATVKNNKSSKLKKAEQLKLKGQDIDILSEEVFLDQINS